MIRRRSILLIAVLLLAALPASARADVHARQGDPAPAPDFPPFSWPLAGDPGPNTWLYEQHFGNTPSAFNFGNIWYPAGQGLHFGLDIEVMCGTPVLAIADGVVTTVDGENFGSAPHNLVIRHTGTGYSSLYGHLLETPRLRYGQIVRRGEVIALSGDPDNSCESRPHLHLEIRSENYTISYNPVPFFDVHWHMLASFGPYDNAFQQDLQTPYRWMTLESQPDVIFGADIVNRYTVTLPIKLELRAPLNPPIARHLPTVTPRTTVTASVITAERWAIGSWWLPTDPAAVYLVDVVPGQGSGVFRQPLDGTPRAYVGPVPPAQTSPDGTITVQRQPDGSMKLTDTRTGGSWEVLTQGVYPAISPDNRQLLWEVYYGELVPGTSHPGVEVWVSDIDGGRARVVHTLANGYTQWLDDHRLLGVRRISYTADVELYILDLNEPGWPQPQMLGTYRYLRGLQIAPGGGRVAFFLPFQDDPAASGIYVQPTEAGRAAVKLDFIGAYRWRDDRSLYTLSFDASTDVHTLGVADVVRRTHLTLTAPADLPLRVANGEWSVSPDGAHIVYVDPADYSLRLLTVR